jgi:hypothetical protein
MYRRGDTIPDIASAFGVSDEAASAKLVRLRRQGKVERRKIHRNGTVARTSTLKELADLYNSGMTWAEVSKHLGYKSADGAFRRFKDLQSRSSVEVELRDARDEFIADMPAPLPSWRDNGIGESIAYQRAAERVEKYVAAGDCRTAAINQVLQEYGVRVR